jgi:hypothetical protein
VAGTRGGNGVNLYEFAHPQQGFVRRDNHFKGFVWICTSWTRFCTNGAITSILFKMNLSIFDEAEPHSLKEICSSGVEQSPFGSQTLFSKDDPWVHH